MGMVLSDRHKEQELVDHRMVQELVDRKVLVDHHKEQELVDHHMVLELVDQGAGVGWP